jgi:hypothetical protein
LIVSRRDVRIPRRLVTLSAAINCSALMPHDWPARTPPLMLFKILKAFGLDIPKLGRRN